MKKLVLLVGLTFFLIGSSHAKDVPSFEKFYGRITKLDQTSNQVTVHNKKSNADSNFLLDGDTAVIVKKEKRSSNDLKEGQFVIVSYLDQNDQKLAKRITVRPSRVEKK